MYYLIWLAHIISIHIISFHPTTPFRRIAKAPQVQSRVELCFDAKHSVSGRARRSEGVIRRGSLPTTIIRPCQMGAWNMAYPQGLSLFGDGKINIQLKCLKTCTSMSDLCEFQYWRACQSLVINLQWYPISGIARP